MDNPFGEQVGDTLAQVNVVRSALGYDPLYELPSSTRGDAAACLYYRALADVGVAGVYGDSIRFQSERTAQLAAELWGTRANGDKVLPPTQMKKTITDFDAGKFGYYSGEGRDTL